MRYRIYYGDGSTYDGDPYWAPSTGVQVITQEDPDQGRVRMHTHDWYVWDERRLQWQPATLDALVLYMQKNGPRKMLFGENLRTADFYACIERALADQEFPDSMVKTELTDRFHGVI